LVILKLGHPAVMQVTFAVVLLKLALRRRGHFFGPFGEGSSFVDHHRSSLCQSFTRPCCFNISTAIRSCYSLNGLLYLFRIWNSLSLKKTLLLSALTRSTLYEYHSFVFFCAVLNSLLSRPLRSCYTLLSEPKYSPLLLSMMLQLLMFAYFSMEIISTIKGFHTGSLLSISECLDSAKSACMISRSTVA